MHGQEKKAQIISAGYLWKKIEKEKSTDIDEEKQKQVADIDEKKNILKGKKADQNIHEK